MLIISRKPGQSFEIGNNVVVNILHIHSGNQIRIGITAPDDVRIFRTELANRIRLENDGKLPSKEA